MADVDETFYERADGHIHLANEHLKDVGRGEVSASFLHGAARFNTYVAACNCDSKSQMEQERSSIRAYYLAEYEKMLDEHLDDYIEHYEEYMGKQGPEA